MSNALPIEAIRSKLLSHWHQQNGALVAAPPGSGKTTRLPLWLLEETDRPIYLLIPKRLPVVLAAKQLAKTLGEPLGKRVGYELRNDSQRGKNTQLVVTTYGTFLRKLLADPDALAEATLLFDEFHERQLEQDLTWALSQELADLFGGDFKRIVMSATLDLDTLATQSGLPLVQSEGRSFPVEIKYQPTSTQDARAIARVIEDRWQQVDHHLLVFAPGAKELRQLDRNLPSSIPRLILHGQQSTPPELASLASATPTVILATNVAESSITLEGVHTVIDSGLERFADTHPLTGLTHLKTRQISKASAKQRAGRAGRQAPGTCLRLVSESAHQARVEHQPPAITQADLTELRLLCAAWGSDGSDLKWLTSPPVSRWKAATDKLKQFGAVDEQDQLTVHGEQMQKAGQSPWLAHLLATGVAENQLPSSALLAAQLAHAPDKVSLEPVNFSDLEKPVRQELERLLARFGQKLPSTLPPLSEETLIHALPDRLIRWTENGQGQLFSGGRTREGAQLKPGWGIVLEASVIDNQVQVHSWLPISESAVLVHAKRTTVINYQPKKKPEFARTESIGQIKLSEVAHSPTEQEREQAWLAALQSDGATLLSWQPEDHQLLARWQFAHNQEESWPATPSPQDWARWAQPFMASAKSLSAIKASDVLLAQLSYDQQTQLNQHYPTHWQAPSGHTHPLQYDTEHGKVKVEVKLQEMFGQSHQPTLPSGLPIQLHLQAPNGRPLAQVTDLSHFWLNVYPEVRKEMRGRYVKHPWPEDPLTAVATRQTNRQLRQTSS